MKKFLAAFALLALFACSKEKQLRNRMDGDWNIDQLEYRTTITDTASGGTIPLVGNNTNAGTVSFQSKAQTGSYTIDAVTQGINVTIPGRPNPVVVPSQRITVTGSGTFTNTADKITIIDGQKAPRVFTVVSSEKKNMVLTTDEPVRVDSLNLNLVVTLTMNLTKK